MSKVALVDMDNTIADYCGAMAKELQKLAKPGELITLSEDDEWNCNRQQLIKHQPGFWRNLPPITLGFDVVNLFKELGFNLTILTKGPNRTASAWTEKKEWCDNYLPGIPLTICENKSLVYGKVLFDDWPPYIEGWLKHRPRGVVAMLHYDWNENFEHPQVVRIRSKDDLPTLKERLLTI